MRVRTLLGTTVVLVALMAELIAQPSDGKVPSLEGVWRIVEVASADPAYPTNSTPQRSQIIYTKKHYSYIAINRPRPKLEEPATAGTFTDAEKIARYEHWRLITAHSGTYEFKDGIVRTRAVAAKNEAVMNGVEEFQVKSKGGLLWLVSEANGYTLKLRRLE